MAKKKAEKTAAPTKLRRRLFGYRRGDVDARVAALSAAFTRQIQELEFEVGRLTEELSVATHANEDLALRATRRAVETILAEARAEAAAIVANAAPVIDTAPAQAEAVAR